ncbi:hypothetical protein MANY_05780 [Mycolicibacterium anyangense]|jgi:hypothetical protein|uniref:Uncharacterized protein n=1 Tax=Mycolicibacterium anyangense TaxID=1431246 RepID=A0A6N4W760_9MYCO|nr:hypothetical protein [Mycolicibacterium anyangense]BBZ75241.1 hypothetical protein MANY_05780 [Mycolicibacterium anyangense]
MADDEKTRWAIDVMTAWAHAERDDFMHDRIDEYLSEPGGAPGLITGLVNLSSLLLMGLEATTGKATPEILQAIASTLSRHEHTPGDS